MDRVIDEKMSGSDQTEYIISVTDSDGKVVTASLFAQLTDMVEDRHTWIEFIKE